MFDFQAFGQCARIDVEPFILPERLTVCYKSTHDFTDAFVFLAFLSTASGNSLVDDFKNKTFREMTHGGGIVNLLHFRKMFGSDGIFPYIGAGHYHKGGLSGFKNSWQRWEQWCAAFDLESGQATTYVNGMDDGTQVHKEWTQDHLAKANAKLTVKNLVTDVLVGCSPWDWSFGQITDLQVFDRILTSMRTEWLLHLRNLNGTYQLCVYLSYQRITGLSSRYLAFVLHHPLIVSMSSSWRTNMSLWGNTIQK